MFAFQESELSSDCWSTVQTAHPGDFAPGKAIKEALEADGDQPFGQETTNNLIILSHFQPQVSWVGRALDAVRHLPSNWDGYGAEPLRWVVVRRLGEILVDIDPAERFYAAAIVPGADGSIQAEWHLRDVSIELCVENDLSVSLTRCDRNSGEIVDFEGDAALNAFLECIEELRR